MGKRIEITIIVIAVLVLIIGVIMLTTDKNFWDMLNNKKEDEEVSLVEPIKDATITVDYGGGVNVLGKEGHNGIDYTVKSEDDTIINSAGDGYVSAVKENKRYGKYVTVSHSDEVETLYAHLKEVTVFYQEEVKQGDKLGIMGSTGQSTGEHVHFEVREQQDENENKEAVDPKEYLEEKGEK